MTPSISRVFAVVVLVSPVSQIGFHRFPSKDGQSSDGLTEMNPGVQKNFRWKVPVEGVTGATQLGWELHI